MISSNSTQAPPSHFLSVPLAMLAMTVVHLSALIVLGREWTGGCVALWQSNMGAGCNSMHPADPYSFMHLAFGIGVGMLFRAMRPTWRGWDIMLLVVFSSTMWELVENLPPVIALFADEGRPDLVYDGDSIVNSLGDTVATALGGIVALTVPRGVGVGVILLVELGSSLWIGDGFLLGLMRLLGG